LTPIFIITAVITADVIAVAMKNIAALLSAIELIKL
jgi:hypothetical protein